jgi:hypothetical protein
VLDSYKKFFAEEYRKESLGKIKRLAEMLNEKEKAQ